MLKSIKYILMKTKMTQATAKNVSRNGVLIRPSLPGGGRITLVSPCQLTRYIFSAIHTTHGHCVIKKLHS